MKLQVLVSDELVTRIDKVAKIYGTSRSSLCASIIGFHLPDWEKAYKEELASLEDLQKPYEQLKLQ